MKFLFIYMKYKILSPVRYFKYLNRYFFLQIVYLRDLRNCKWL